MNLVTAILDDLKTKVETIDAFSKKTIKFIEPDVLAKGFDGVSLPACALAYEGLRAVATPGSQPRVSHRVGLSASGSFGIYVVFANLKNITLRETYTDQTTVIMDSVRNAVKDTRSPVGHYYEFVAEFPFILKGHTVWVQRWNTPVPKV